MALGNTYKEGWVKENPLKTNWSKKRKQKQKTNWSLSPIGCYLLPVLRSGSVELFIINSSLGYSVCVKRY